MEKPIIKLGDNHYESDKDIVNLLKYIAGKGKNKGTEIVLCQNGRGVSKKVEEAAEEMIIVQEAYRKAKKRRMYQLIVSLPKNIHNKNVIIKIAREISDMLYENYQIFYGIHISKENWHIHYAINAVSYQTGKKWHQNKKEFDKMKREIIKVVERHTNM